MRVHARILTISLRALKWVAGSIAIIALIFIVGRLYSHALPAEAASSTYYPHFCLGGWEYPQHASGPASLDPGADPSAFTSENSAFLGTSVSSQIFCGYFPISSKSSAPTQVKVTFSWTMLYGGSSGTHTDPTTYTSTSSNSSPISPSTGLTPPPPTNPTNPTGPATTTPPTDPTPPATTTTPTDPAPPPSDPPPTTPPATLPSDPPANAPPSDPATSTQSLNVSNRILAALSSFIAEQAHAQEDASASSSDIFSPNDFLDVSYSLDGIRWTSIGHVSRTNWQNFSVNIPIHTWDDLKRLQIMVSVLPTIDEKPDIYLESMALKVDYGQSLGQLASDGLAAVSDAVDSLLGDDTATDTPDVPVPRAQPAPVMPFTTQIVHKKLLFSMNGSVIPRPAGEPVSASGSGEAMTISGACNEKYFVILIYKNQDDYGRKASSYVANDAHPCIGGSFAFNLASLSPELPAGSYYLLTASEGDAGSWKPTGNLIPITITATTSVETVTE